MVMTIVFIGKNILNNRLLNLYTIKLSIIKKTLVHKLSVKENTNNY